MKIQISYALDIDVDALRARYKEELKYGDTISQIYAVLLKQLDLVEAGDFDGAYELIKDWGAHERSFMDPVTTDIMNMIKDNRDKANYSAKRSFNIVQEA
jgi:hypothetical protein